MEQRTLERDRVFLLYSKKFGQQENFPEQIECMKSGQMSLDSDGQDLLE